MKKKSALEVSTAILFIVLLLVSGVLLIVSIKLSKTAKKETNIKACEYDIKKAYLSKRFPNPGSLLTRGNRLSSLSNCRRDKLGDLIIKYKDVVKNGVIDQNKAHKIIADEMVKCWKMVGEGKIDPFSNWDTKGISYCLVCSTIRYDDRLLKFIKLNNKKISKKEDIAKYNILGIDEYLRTNRITKNGPTFYEYLYKEKPPIPEDTIKKIKENNLQNKTNIILPNSLIIVRMYKAKQKSTLSSIGGAIVGSLLVIGGTVIAATGFGAPLGAAIISIGLGAATGAIGIALLVNTASEAYDACIPDCNGIGGITIIPSEVPLSQEIPMEIDGKQVMKPICDIIVN